MPAISDYEAIDRTLMIVMGDSGAGKTGALASLADAGYRLWVLDLEGKLNVLVNLLTDPASPYKNGGAARVMYKTITDDMKAIAGRPQVTKANIWSGTLDALSDWKEKLPDGTTKSYGNPTTWGTRDIVVIDTFTALCRGAGNWYLQMNGNLGKDITWVDHKIIQPHLERFLVSLTSKAIKCHVVMLAHVEYIQSDVNKKSTDDDSWKIGVPRSISQNFSRKVGASFNETVRLMRGQLYTGSMPDMDLKTSAPNRVKSQYPIKTGLADYFRALHGPLPPEEPSA